MTKLLVLGLLDEGPLSGYDIQQKVNQADAGRWGGVLPGSVYHALKKLEQEGSVVLANVELTGHRQRAVYRITSRGREHLQALVLEVLRAPSALYPTDLYSGLSLLGKVPGAAARNALEGQKRRLEEEACALAQGQASNKAAGQRVSPISLAVISNMRAIVEGQLALLDQLLSLVEEGQQT